MQLGQRLACVSDRAGGGDEFAGEKFRKSATVFIAGRGDRHACGRSKGDVNVFEHHVAVRVLHANVAEHHITVERWHFFRLTIKQRAIDHTIGGKPLHDGFPAQRHVCTLVVIGQQFFPRAGQVLVRGKCRHKGADRHFTLDREVATNRVEEEGRELTDEVVEKLHEELLLEDLKANGKEPAQPVREHRHSEAPPAVGAQRAGPCGAFANLSGQRADLDHAFLVQQVDLALQFGDEPSL